MATGLGKTIVSALQLKRMLAESPGRVLYVTHQNEILRQARHTYESILPSETTYGYFHGQEKHLHRVDVLFASFQTMAISREQFARDEFKYVIVDEAHHVHAETYRPTVEYFQPDFMIGLTATPDRADQKDIRQLMGEPVFDLGLFEALADQHLTPIDYRLMTDELQNLEVLETPAGKLSIAELNRTIFVPKRDEEIVRIIEEKLEGVTNPRTIIFCSSVAHAEQLGELMPYAQVIHSKVHKDQRMRRIAAFRKGHSRIVITVDMFNEGIDIPEANVIVFLRSTASRTIYLQQLGRGLRRIEGKEKVLVLDFVANCERIEMIDYVQKGVTNAIESSGETASGEGEGETEPTSRGVLTLTIDGGEFDERLVNLVELIQVTREGYTEDILIGQIKSLAEELGRVPQFNDFNGREGYASTSAFIARFRSWNEALRAAGFDPNREFSFYTNEELIQQLKNIGLRVKRTPRMSDLNPPHTAHHATFTGRFGSWHKALQAAGFAPSYAVRYDRAYLINRLREINETLGRTPILSDLDSLDDVNARMFAREFGSWNAALAAAGLIPTRKRHTRQDMIEQIQHFHEQHGRAPTIRELGRKHSTASHANFLRMFGTYEEALKAAGVSTVPTREALIVALQELGAELGKPPSLKDLDDAPSLPSRSTFRSLFGSWNNALIAAGFPSGKTVYTRAILVQQLQALGSELGRKPRIEDVVGRKGSMANITTFQSHFGSWVKALKAAGY